MKGNEMPVIDYGLRGETHLLQSNQPEQTKKIKPAAKAGVISGSSRRYFMVVRTLAKRENIKMW